ncbi:hypothetical protein R5O87_11135 [Arthrobacter globiformis]|uniref:hypothetical protein n=1 Tax=Arthrobacter globiformis TaxID=1665 RepID=UPI0039780D86
MGHAPTDTRSRLTEVSLAVAEFAHAHWFFGNLYEAVVKVPHRVAGSEDGPGLRRSPLGPGSPGRYYAPLAPATFPAVALALAAGWNRPGSRPWLVTAAAASATGGAVTAYLLRSVNPPLFFGPQPPSEMRRNPLLARWYRVNALRLAASAVALAAIDRARLAGLRSGCAPGF